MTDAREVVQPRWKRRATEIADAIGGGTTSSVKLDGTPQNSNTVDSLAAAIAGALQLVTLDVNIKTYDNVNYGTAGMPIQQGYSAVTGNRLPFHVAQQGSVDVNLQEYMGASIGTANPIDINFAKYGNTSVGSLGNGLPVIHVGQTGPLPINITQYAGTNIGTTGIPIKQGQGAVTGNIIPFKVAEQNTVPVDIQQINGTNIIGTSISVTESNPVSGGTVNFPSTMAVTGTVSVDNHPSTISVTGTVGVNNHPTTTTISGTVPVTLPVDANNVTLPLAVTETNPVSGGGGTTTGVQNVKIVGDETSGIIMSKTFSSVGDYSCLAFGLGAHTQYYNTPGTQGATNTFGWTIRVNGVDIINQDITLDLRGTTPTPLTNPMNQGQVAAQQPRLINIDSQATVDKYHGRKVTLSSVANVWIIEPLESDIKEGLYIKGTAIHGTSGSNTIDIWTVIDENGVKHVSQRILHDTVNQVVANQYHVYGAQLFRFMQGRWFIIGTDTI